MTALPLRALASSPAFLTGLAACSALAAACLPLPWSLAPAGLSCWAALTGFFRLRRELATACRQKCALDEQLLQSQKLAAIGEIAAGVAHEINNPLAVITQESEWLGHLLRSDPPQPEEAQQSLQVIQSQTARCGDITRNLLNLARTWTPVRQPSDVNRCIEDMVRLVEREARPGGVHMVRAYAANLPKAPLDPPLFRQAVLNLLVNAMQAAGKGGTVTVETALAPDGRISVRVCDDGPGIRPEHISRVFDPFFTTKAPGKGTGLGLSITQRIVDKLGGFISVENLPAKGAAFTITLPAQAQETGVKP